ncbi:MAG: DUF2809 domain-containing protein [Mariniphaga sp.]
MIKRKRFLYIIATLIVIILGLASRKLSNHLPEIINRYMGDALWALMIYIYVGIIFRKLPIKRVAISSLLFCYMIELSQLYHAPWIDQIRNTRLGGLVLGFGFLWSDILAYTMGVGIGMFIEWMIYKYMTIK